MGHFEEAEVEEAMNEGTVDLHVFSRIQELNGLCLGCENFIISPTSWPRLGGGLPPHSPCLLWFQK